MRPALPASVAISSSPSASTEMLRSPFAAAPKTLDRTPTFVSRFCLSDAIRVCNSLSRSSLRTRSVITSQVMSGPM